MSLLARVAPQWKISHWFPCISVLRSIRIQSCQFIGREPWFRKGVRYLAAIFWRMGMQPSNRGHRSIKYDWDMASDDQVSGRSTVETSY